MIGNLTALLLFPLQVTDMTAFNMDTKMDPKAFIGFGIAIAVIIIIVIIYNSFNKSGASSGGKSSGGGLSAMLSMSRLAKDLELSYEQKKMLNFVFKTDSVIEPEKSLVSPALLDRHFRRAYRVIEQTSDSPQEALHRHAILFSTRNLLENSYFGGVSSTRQLNDDTTLTLTNGKDKMNVNVLSAKGDFLAVETPKNVLGSQIKIPRGTRLSVMFFTKSNKCFSFETRVTGATPVHGHPSLQLAHSNNLRFRSQRRYRRKSAVIACFLFVVYVEGKGKKQRLVVDKRRMGGTITDISVGGCSIKTNAPVTVGARIKIDFTQGENNVAALGQILRTNRVGTNTVLHVKFVRITQKSMNLINAFVYEYVTE